MRQIIICEDDRYLRDQVSGYIEAYLDKFKIGELVLSTDAPEDVLAYIEKEEELPRFVYLLDIEFGTAMDGMSLAKNIRNIDPTGEIIFVTNYNEYMIRSFRYKLKALEYIKKGPDLETRIIECMEDIRNKILFEEDDQWLVVKTGSGSYRNRYKSIVAIEGTDYHKVKIIEIDKPEPYEVTGSLAGVEATLEYPFIRIHRSILVNAMYIKRNYRDHQALHVEMCNDKIYPVSRTYAREVIDRDRYSR